MSSRFDRHPLTRLEEQACAEASERFIEHLQQFPITRMAVERLEMDMAKIALAANLAASKTPTAQSIDTYDGKQWFKDIGLINNVYLCHRRVTGGVEFAIVEHIPSKGSNEIWSWGRNAIEVLRVFVQEQRKMLEVWTEDLAAQVKEFLAQTYPGQNMSRATSTFIHQLTHMVPRQAT